jgi:hypothetical protein
VTQDAPSFFTLDRGTVTTAATLIAPVDGRYRLLAAGVAPSSIDSEALLEDLAWRVARTDASVAGSLQGWQDWARLEVRTWRTPRACLVAASPETGAQLERAFLGAGWQVAARVFGPDPDLVAFGEACLDPEVDAVAVGARDDVEQEERDRVRLLWPRAGSLARLRDDLAVLACGPFVERPEAIPDERLFSLPAPEPASLTAETRLRQAAREIGAHLVTGSPAAAAADGRAALRTSLVSLAVLLGNRVDGIEIGAAAGSRTQANADGELGHAVLATAGLLPRQVLDDDDAAEAVLRWSSAAGDPATRLDRLRQLTLSPWSQIDADGLHLRMTALRAALERMQETWQAGLDGRPDATSGDVVVLSGGGFSVVPPAAAALAIADGIRHPGAFTILHDHARLMAPLGALPVEGDRRRLLADLMDDALLPVGSALLTGANGRHGSDPGSVAVSSELGEEELALETGQLRLVDLPPGIVARLDVDPGPGTILGVEGRRFRLEVSGGLGGLLIDTRPIPLELPASPEQRRATLEAWEAAAWLGSER